MGFKETLKSIWSGSKKEPEVGNKLEGLGITILLDKKLAEKQLALQTMFDDLEDDIDTTNPLEYLEELDKRLKMLNRAIHSLASPFYRAGTNANFREMMEGWVLWFAVGEYCIHAVEDRIKSIYVIEDKTEGQTEQELINRKASATMNKSLASVTAIDVWTLVRRLHTVLQLHVFQDGMLVMAESYLNQDVAPSTATIVKTMPGRGGFNFDDLKTEET